MKGIFGDKLAENQQIVGNHLLETVRREVNLFEFSEDEFDECKDSITSEGLIKVLKAVDIRIPDAKTPIEWLNKLLKNKNLYEQKGMVKRTPEIDHMVKEFKGRKSVDVVRLNRLLIEVNYPRETPKMGKSKHRIKLPKGGIPSISPKCIQVVINCDANLMEIKKEIDRIITSIQRLRHGTPVFSAIVSSSLKVN